MARRPTVVLKNEHKAFIVQRLALFDTPTQAVEAVKETFGLEISAQRAEAYNPDRRAGGKLSEVWRILFEQTRARFLEKLKKIPETNREVRVRELAKLSRAARHFGNYSAAASLFSQIAGEMGEVLEHRYAATVTDDEFNAQLRRLLGRKMSASLRMSAVASDSKSRPAAARRSSSRTSTP